mgnify:FL=1
MSDPSRHVCRWRLALMVACVLACAVGGCAKKKQRGPRYVTLPLREVPEYFKDSLLQRVDVSNTEPFMVAGYGLVGGLDNTGGTEGTPLAVRNFMIDEMVKRGFNQRVFGDRYRYMKPETMLQDRRFAIVVAFGYIPPGARKGQRTDVYVQALRDSNVSSLSRGHLFRTDLRVGGANPMNPGGAINVYMKGEGPIFVNPAYALSVPTLESPPAMRISLRSGSILDGGLITSDRYIVIRVRQPQMSMARAIESRINFQFPKTSEDDLQIAQAQDEGTVHVFVPRSFNGDWERFLGVTMHLFLNGSSDFSALKARTLAEEAVKPDAPLLDISFAWEGLGSAALPYVLPLMTHASPDVSYAAARAAAFIGDPSGSAAEALLQIAQTDAHPFQLSAVKTLGALPPSPRVDGMLDRLLDSPLTLVRIEAYQILARHRHPRIHSQVIRDSFVLDVVPTTGPPLVYATRSGIPRIAVFGPELALTMPVVFDAFDYRFTMTTDSVDRNRLRLFYRNDDGRAPITAGSRPRVAELIYRLGGGSAEGMGGVFTYCDIVAMLQALADRKDLPAAFVLQDVPTLQDMLDEAPAIGEEPERPQAESQAPHDQRAAGDSRQSRQGR